MPKYYYIKNWDKFQHYKDRCPPWIKLHWEIFSSEDWIMLADASRLLAFVCMLIASRNEGRVPNNPAYIKRIAYLDKTPDLKPLIECGFLIEMQAGASKSKQKQADVTTETETEKRQSTSKKGMNGRFPEFWNLTPKKVGRKKAEALCQAITKRGEATEEQLIEGMKAYAKSVEGTDPKYICHPTTWLNQGRWADEIKPKGRTRG